MTVRRLLIRLPNWLGDLLMSRPLLHAVRATWPKASITALGPPASRLLAREAVWDEWESWPDLAAPGARERRGRLLQSGFDAALVLPPSFSSAFSIPRSIPYRVGFAGEGRSPWLTHAIRRTARGEMHLSEEFLRLGKALGLGPEASRLPSLRPTHEESSEAREQLRKLGLDGRPHVALGPGAVFGPAKRWPAERFAALGRRLVRAGLAVLTCGAEEDRGAAEAIAAAIGEGARSLAGRTGLEMQLALCATAHATVSNDSGLAHLAAASGAPTVAIFGSTCSAWTAPLGPRVTVIQHAPVCSPCFRRTCRIGYTCLEAVEVAEVERACLEAAS